MLLSVDGRAHGVQHFPSGVVNLRAIRESERFAEPFCGLLKASQLISKSPIALCSLLSLQSLF